MRSPTNQMRRAQTVDGGGRKRNRDYAPIRIVIRAISPYLARQTEGGGVGEEETIYASGRPSIYAVSLESNSWLPRGMLERYVDGRIRAIPSFARNTAAE